MQGFTWLFAVGLLLAPALVRAQAPEPVAEPGVAAAPEPETAPPAPAPDLLAPAPAAALPAPAAPTVPATALPPVSVPEAEPLPGGGEELIELMVELDSQLDATVISSTKTAQRAIEVPAVVTVITADEIAARGYTSLAEVLRSVPGLYDVHDLVTHNVGIRGVNGGARASGSVLKLMIDGNAVHFRPSTGNFFGEELIPLAAVARVEVIRGPASALYGANAFLGVINLITKTGREAEGFRLVGQGGLVRDNAPSYGGGFLLGGGSETGEVMVAAHAMRVDRSGLSVPAVSPIFDLSRNPVAGEVSRDDLARPRTAFAKASVGAPERGRATIWASIQNLDASGEFQDFSPMSHRTRIALLNQNYRLSYELEPSPQLGLKVSGGYFDSSPSDAERLNLGRPDQDLLRNVGVTGYELTAEGRVKPIDALTLTLGGDYVEEKHTLQTFDLLIVSSPPGSPQAPGTVLPGEEQGKQRYFVNFGAFAQALYDVTGNLGATAGIRLDDHNVYGTHLSPRLGLVYVSEEPTFTVKALYGTSFKAPSAEQLFTQPIRLPDIKGNEELAAQEAQTGELAGAVKLGDVGEVSANLFLTRIEDRVEFIQRGLFLSAENSLDELFAGGELDARFRILDPLHARVGAGVAQLLSRTQKEEGVLIGVPEVGQPLFPALQLHLVVDYLLPVVHFRLSPELSYIGAREASQSNALENNAAYELPGYFYTALSLSMADRQLLGARATSFSLRAANLLDDDHVEPGFGGIDVPAQGRTLFLTVTQQL